jgi:two-component system, response regulator YesN
MPTIAQLEAAEKCRKFIEQNYAEGFDIDKMGSQHYISGSYLSRMFRNVMGISGRDYLTQIRLDVAKTMLKYNLEMSIEDIALKIGYASEIYFRKVFRTKFGMEPSIYREKAIKKRKEG